MNGPSLLKTERTVIARIFKSTPKLQFVDVPNVELEPLAERDELTAIHRRPAGDPRANVVTMILLGSVLRQILDVMQARADEAHLAGDYVPKLGQLVDAGSPQEAPKRREALCVDAEVDLLPVFGRARRAGLPARERLLLVSGALVREEIGRPSTRPSRERTRGDRRSTRSDRHRADDVNRALREEHETARGLRHLHPASLQRNFPAEDCTHAHCVRTISMSRFTPRGEREHVPLDLRGAVLPAFLRQAVRLADRRV